MCRVGWGAGRSRAARSVDTGFYSCPRQSCAPRALSQFSADSTSWAGNGLGPSFLGEIFIRYEAKCPVFIALIYSLRHSCWISKHPQARRPFIWGRWDRTSGSPCILTSIIQVRKQRLGEAGRLVRGRPAGRWRGARSPVQGTQGPGEVTPAGVWLAG